MELGKEKQEFIVTSINYLNNIIGEIDDQLTKLESKKKVKGTKMSDFSEKVTKKDNQGIEVTLDITYYKDKSTFTTYTRGKVIQNLMEYLNLINIMAAVINNPLLSTSKKKFRLSDEIRGALTAYISGLKYEIKILLLLKAFKPASLSDALNMALNIEKQRNKSYLSKNMNNITRNVFLSNLIYM
ncbi:hypothetical protein M0802_014005 [Mischocyttarus mexicanus]|nr:hypothetical protein M0802_014005 [Mischocyttarus mexicanus]